MGGKKSIDDATTTNIAFFTKLDKEYEDFSLSFGARLDSTKITSANSALQNNNYTALNLNMFSKYNLDEENKIFLGIGKASRVPDARELYFYNLKSHTTVGTPDLDQTTNTEIDLGYELQGDMLNIKIKGFYSMLNNYIYIQKGVMTNAFKNVDATVYGAELQGSYFATDEITVDLGASYKVGQRDKALSGQTGTNLANIAPLRGSLALNYEYMNASVASIKARASDTWDKFDAENGEQKLAAWAILDMKLKHTFNKSFDFTAGVNNLFNANYAQSNTYANLNLVTSGATGNVMLLNEPGRYIYTNLNVKF